MSGIDLTQIEADSLIGVEKHWADWETDKILKPLDYPSLGGLLNVPLVCVNKQEHFILSVRRACLTITKQTKQLRGRQTIPLIRLDLGGPPHRNPDNTEIPCPHLHIYREGWGDKWAIAVPEDKFKNLNDSLQTLEDFLLYCNVTKPPKFSGGLFI